MAWRTMTSVRFAVLQISILAVAGVIGAILPQIPAFALRDPAAYATEVAKLEAQFERLSVLGLHIGPAFVDIAERLGFFRIFSAPWFILLLTVLVVSIVVCTLDRTPDLWRKASRVRITQAAPFYDLRLDDRARFVRAEPGAADELVKVLRERRYKVRQVMEEPTAEESPAAQVRHVYADRNQYFKLATLFTHLGLILFLAGAAVTTGLGDETVIFLGEGQTAPVQAVGTPDNMLVKNIHFEAPQRPDGSFADFRTDLAVYQNGQEVARKIIRVNDPLEVNGYVFHQNTFGPAAELTIRDATGALAWDGPILLAGEFADLPQGFITIPGSEIGLLLVLDRTIDGIPQLAVTGLGPTASPDESSIIFLEALRLGDTSAPMDTAGYTVTWKAAAAYTGMVIKRDPGQGLIWVAYLALITGLVLTFYFPRRRLWARQHGDQLEMAFLADRYVDSEREFGQLLDDVSTRLRNRPERRLQPSPRPERA
jgi:cytochrome c biogenesis protein